MTDGLLVAAILPIIGLCYFVYKKDVNKEPTNLLMRLLGFGALSVIPVIICEVILNAFINTDKDPNFLSIFIKVFIGVALVEEGFKWLFVKLKAYDTREFDEVYDIIVYSVFVSLGFAAVENILYVASGGIGVAILRAILSVPGHAVFAVFMGYYFSKAKIASINNNKSLTTKNMILSLLVPIIFHTLYDALLIWYENTEISNIIIYFFIFDVVMVIIGIIIVNKTSKVQQNLYVNIEQGNLINNQGILEMKKANTINFCPLCGNNVSTGHFCSKCGLKIR